MKSTQLIKTENELRGEFIMKKALLNIDYTNDFVATNGKLTCGEPGQKLLNYICNLTADFHRQ